MLTRPTLFLLALLAAGCGSGGPRTYRIPGRLVYTDGSPVPGASVVLQTHVNDQVVSARGMATPDGRFSLTTFKEGDGVVAGKHEVSISPLPAPDEGKPAQQLVANKYWDFATSDLKAEVTPETRDIVITIERPAKK